MNKVVLRGLVSRVFDGSNNEKLVVIRIRNGMLSNLPIVEFQEFPYKSGDFVEIEGEMAHEKRNDRNRQFIKGISVTKVESIMAEKFQKPLGGTCSFKNEVLIEGTILSVRFNKGVCKIDIIPDDSEDKWAYSFVGYHLPDDFTERFKPEDHVCIYGKIQTEVKEIKGQTRFFKNLVLYKISKITVNKPVHKKRNRRRKKAEVAAEKK